MNLLRRIDADVDGGAHVVGVRECGGERGVHGRHEEAFPGMRYNVFEISMITIFDTCIQSGKLRGRERPSYCVVGFKRVRILRSIAQGWISKSDKNCHIET